MNVYTKLGEQEFLKAGAELCEQLQDLAEGKVRLREICHERYDSMGRDICITYRDPQGIGLTLNEICLYLSACIDRGDFQRGYELGKNLVVLKLQTDGSADGEPVPFAAVKPRDRICDRAPQAVADAVYVTLLAHPLEERAQALYQLLKSMHRLYVSYHLEDMLEQNKEIPDREEFLSLWLHFLGPKQDELARKLMKEAVTLLEDPDKLLKAARAYSDVHPDLYEAYLAREQDHLSPEDLRSVCQEAMEHIPPEYSPRADAAKRLAKLELQEGHKAEAERLWLEIFRSDTRPVNLLRLMRESDHYDQMAEEIREIYRSMLPKKGARRTVGQADSALNRPERAELYMDALLWGEIRLVAEEAMDPKGDELFFGGPCLEPGLAALILFLLPGEELPPVCRQVRTQLAIQMHFWLRDYNEALWPEKTKGGALLWSCLRRWRAHKNLNPNQLGRLQTFVERRLDQAVQIVMQYGWGDQDLYSKYICAFGEVKEANGAPGERDRFIRKYRRKYSGTKLASELDRLRAHPEDDETLKRGAPDFLLEMMED